MSQGCRTTGEPVHVRPGVKFPLCPPVMIFPDQRSLEYCVFFFFSRVALLKSVRPGIKTRWALGAAGIVVVRLAEVDAGNMPMDALFHQVEQSEVLRAYLSDCQRSGGTKSQITPSITEGAQ